MIKKLLSGKKRFTLSECAQGCDCTEKDILQFASEGNINLQANLAYTEGDLYVINDSIDTPKELKPRSWKGYQTLTPNFCEKLLRNFDKEVSITSIVATQEEREEFNLDYNDTVEISLDPSIIVSGDPLDPLGSNIQKDYQYITTKDVWISKEEYERLRPENKDDHGKLDRNTDENFEETEEEFKKFDEKKIKNLKNKRYDELSQLLKDILQKEGDKGEDISANAIWNVLKKELTRNNRKYDKNGILIKSIPSTTSFGILYWVKGKNKSETPCSFRTLTNKLSKIRKNSH
jgi:hypothetical protein